MPHTPGPWVNMPKGAFWGEVRSAETFELIAVMPECDDRTADFELIAAAPDLLAACEAALPIVCSRIEYPGDPCEKIANGIRAAIAKARGGGQNDVGRRCRG